MTALRLLACCLLMVAASVCLPCWAQATDDDRTYQSDPVLAQQALDRHRFFQRFAEQSLLVDGKRLHVVSGGRGTPVVLLHGWPGSWQSWHKVMPLLAAGHHVVAIDLPGFGQSDPLPSADKRAIAIHLRHAMRALGLDRPVLVGHDMGLPVAYAYAAQFRDEVRAIVAIDTAVPGFGLANGKADDVMIVTPGRNAWHIPLFMNVPVATMLLPGRERALLESMTAHSLYNKRAIAPGDMADLVEAMTRNGNMPSTLRYYAAWFEDARDNTAFARDLLQIPALAIGAESGFLAQHTAYSMRKVAADVVDIVIPRTGHFIAEEGPVLLAEVLLAFIDGLPERNNNATR